MLINKRARTAWESLKEYNTEPATGQKDIIGNDYSPSQGLLKNQLTADDPKVRADRKIGQPGKFDDTWNSVNND